MGGSTSTYTTTVTFNPAPTNGPPLTTQWNSTCPGPGPMASLTLATANLANPTVWIVPPWYDGPTSCLPPSYVELLNVNYVTPTLLPYSPAICPGNFYTAIANYNPDRKQVEAICCQSEFSLAIDSNNMPLGCTATFTEYVNATYTSVAVSPTLHPVVTQVSLGAGVVFGLSVAVAWRTNDLGSFPNESRPTVDPTWHMGLSEDGKIGLGTGLGIGLPMLVLLGAGIVYGKVWWQRFEAFVDNRPPPPPQITYPEAS